MFKQRYFGCHVEMVLIKFTHKIKHILFNGSQGGLVTADYVAECNNRKWSQIMFVNTSWPKK